MEVNQKATDTTNEGLLQVNRDNEGLQALYPTEDNVPPKIESQYHETRPRRILGLGVASFWILIIVLVLILAGAIGGGVGGGLAAQKKSSSPQPTTATPTTASSSSASTSTTTSATPGSTSPTISSPCTNDPSSNGSILNAYSPSGAQMASFTLACNTNYPAGSTYFNPDVTDLYSFYVPTLEDCMSACVYYNLGNAVSNGGAKCAVVSIVKGPGGLCYFKSATGNNNTQATAGTTFDSAILG